jgi:hypothetical protein
MKKYILIIAMLALTGCASTVKPNFVLLENTAVDQNTGLVWTKNANLPGKQLTWRGDPYAIVNVYDFVQSVNAKNYEGYSDWRVPTKEEMEKMLGYAKSLGYKQDNLNTWPYKQLGGLGFTDVRDYEYWTSARKNSKIMYTADLTSGKIIPTKEEKPCYLWLVRGNSR